MIAVLEALHLFFSGAVGGIDPSEKNEALARAAAMAELGLNGRAQKKALRLIHRLGPHDAPVGGEIITPHDEELKRIQDAYNEFVPELWKAAHPFRSCFGLLSRPASLPAPDSVYHSQGKPS